jgi:hypothetical protein
MPETRPEEQHPHLLTSRQVGEPGRSCGASKGESAVPIDAGEANESFAEILAAHTFDWTTPKAFHLANNGYIPLVFVGGIMNYKLLYTVG